MRDERNYFCIAARGKHFDTDSYASTSSLKIARVERRGQQNPNTGVPFELNGIEIDLGNGKELGIDEQQLMAVKFLKKNAPELKQLCSAPGVETFYLGLQEGVIPDSLGSIMDISPTLMKAAVEIGIGITIWACVHGRQP